MGGAKKKNVTIHFEEKEGLGCDHDHQFVGSFVDDFHSFGSLENESHHFDWSREDDGYESDGDDSVGRVERMVYWDSQESLLQEIMEQYGSSGSKLRAEISRQIEMGRERNPCRCTDPKSGGCAKCLRRVIVDLLSLKGFNASLRTSKWRNTHKFPGGTHEYIEVIASTQGRKKQIPFLIELEFREEFRMAKASDEYLRLIDQLPEIYVGKADHLHAIVRVICDAAKRSTTEKKVHMGPWRNKSFMQMKWSATQERQSIDHRTVLSGQGRGPVGYR